MRVIALVVILSACHGLSKASDLFSSMSDMEELFEKEGQVAEVMEKFVKSLDSQISSLDNFLNAYYKVRDSW